MSRYSVPTGGRPWGQDEYSLILDAYCAVRFERQFDGLCDRLATELGRGNRHRDDGSTIGLLVERKLWEVVLVEDYYNDPSPSRVNRADDPPTLGELEIVRMATGKTNSTHIKLQRPNAKPGPAYVAKLLNRAVPWTADVMRKHGPAKGREGFGYIEQGANS